MPEALGYNEGVLDAHDSPDVRSRMNASQLGRRWRPLMASALLMSLSGMLPSDDAVAAPGPTVVQAAGDEREEESWAPVPFGVGELLEYELEAKWFLVRGGGTASLNVEAIDTIHGHPTYRLGFRTRGGITLFKINDLQHSWLDVNTLFSRRFEQKLDQTGYSRDRTYDFLPKEMRFVALENPADSGRLATPEPLDDVSFIYHIRTLPLVVGKTYTAARYFKQEGNPVTVKVLRTERIRVPAGEFDAIVVKPVIRTKGLFSEGGEAEVWFSNDERRIPLKVRAKVSIATLTMELKQLSTGRRGAREPLAPPPR